MTCADARALATLAVLLARRQDGTSSHACADAAALFSRLARSYQRIQETACDRELTPHETGRETRLEDRALLASNVWALGM